MSEDVTQAEAASEELSALIMRLAGDLELRDALKQDPIGTLKREFGYEVPEGTTIRVVENTPERVHLVLPPRPE